MADLETLYPQVKAYAENVPSLMVQKALSTAARELFTGAGCWTEEVTNELASGDSAFTPELDNAAYEWVWIKWLKIDDELIEPASFEIQPDARDGMPQIYGRSGSHVMLFPTADKGYRAVTSLVTRPVLNGSTLPDEQLALYGTAIAHGAAAELMMQRGYAWYNPKQSVFHRARLNAGIQQGAAWVSTGYSRANDNVTMRPMA